MPITPIRALVQNELKAVEQSIGDALQSEVSIISDLGRYVVQSGGKRLRPLVLLLLSRFSNAASQHAISLATAIELIHTATLLHDDVVDNAITRRGRETANHRFGNEASVLVGDFLYSKAFQLLLTVPDITTLRLVADATNIMAEGEALQLLQRSNIDINETDYLRIIRCKTAKLFEVSAALAAILANSNPDTINAFKQYGLYLGIAFQLMDDLFDYDAIEKNTGKTLGNDFAEGKITLPLIYLFKHGVDADIAFVKAALQSKEKIHFPQVQQILKSSGALDYTKNLAKLEAEKAKAALIPLGDSLYLNAARQLADFAVARDH